MKKKIDQLTAEEWNNYTAEVAEKMAKNHPTRNTVTYSDYYHNDVDHLSKKYNDWIDTILKKYNQFRGLNDKVTLKDIEALEKIENKEDIKSFLVDDRFIDDKLNCAIVYINGIRAEFWYYETLGFLDYWKDSNTAFDNLKDAIKTYGQIWRDSQ
jgi:hypothetical protein